MDERTRDLVARYVNGTLDDERCSEVERSALLDPEVAREIEGALTPVAGAFRSAFPYVTHDTADRDRPRVLAMRMSGVLAIVASAASLAAVAMLFWPRAEGLVLASSPGRVFVDGREVAPGARVPFGAEVVSVGGATFLLEGVKVQTDPVLGRFRVESREEGAKFEDVVGSFSFDAPQSHGPYTVAYEGGVARPLGTRFVVSQPSEAWRGVSVLERRVEVSGSGGTIVLSEGQSTADRVNRGLVQDDLEAIPVGGAMKIPARGGLKDAVRAAPQAVPSELQRGLAAIAGSSRSWTPRKLWDAALICAQFEETTAAANFATAALDAGVPQLSDQELWTMARTQATKPGDHALALRLLDELGRREGGRAVAPYRALVSAWDAPEEKGQRRIEAARALLQLDRREDDLLVAEGLVFGYQEYQFDKGVLLFAQDRLWTVINDPATPIRTRATAYHRLGEATYYIGEKQKSIEWTKKAVELWPRPRWKVHVGTRMTECDAAPLDEALKWIQQGLVEEPSYYAYERAVVAVYAGATKKSDFDMLRDLFGFVAKTYRSVPDAQAHMAQWMALDYGDLSGAEPVMARAMELYGGWESTLVSQNYRNDWGSVLWNAGRREEGLAVAMATIRSSDDVGLIGFYSRIRDYQAMLAALDSTPADQRAEGYHVERGEVLRKLGRKREALAEYRQAIAAEDAHYAKFGRWNEVGLLATSLVGAAECTSSRRAARSLAQKAMEAFMVQGETSVGGRAGRRLLEARAQFVLGEREKAVEIVRGFLAGPCIVEQVREAQELLKKIGAVPQ